MVFLNFLPDVLKELTKHVPTLMFELIDWTDLGKEIPKITSRLIQKEGLSELIQKQNLFLEPTGLKFDDQGALKHAPDASPKEMGQSILKLYFAQVFSPHGVLLDLRKKPSSLWTKLSPIFQTGLIHMYQGFYQKNDALMEEGLIETGLMKQDWSKEKKEELLTLLKSHFGNALDSEMKFELVHFKNSFIKLAGFLVSNKVKISPDFMYLGVYLVSLYLSLQEINEPLPVRSIFDEINLHCQKTN